MTQPSPSRTRYAGIGPPLTALKNERVEVSGTCVCGSVPSETSGAVPECTLRERLETREVAAVQVGRSLDVAADANSRAQRARSRDIVTDYLDARATAVGRDGDTGVWAGGRAARRSLYRFKLT